MKFDYAVPLFEKERMADEIARYERAQEERKYFLSQFPIDRVKGLSLNEYAFVSSADDDRHSFCTIMYSELEEITHTGNAYTHMFGIYYKKDKELALSPTYRKLFGDDFDKAFEQIKSDIYELLVDEDLNAFQLYGEEREAVTKVRINQGFLEISCWRSIHRVHCAKSMISHCL